MGVEVLRMAYATIDDRTTAVCLHAAGQVVAPGEPYHTLAGTFDCPPFHARCRTKEGPYVRGALMEQRAAANAELMERPKEERRIGPDGELGVPTPQYAASNPPAEIAAGGKRAAWYDTDLWAGEGAEDDGVTMLDVIERVARRAKAAKAAKAAAVTGSQAARSASVAARVVKKAAPRALDGPELISEAHRMVKAAGKAGVSDDLWAAHAHLTTAERKKLLGWAQQLVDGSGAMTPAKYLDMEKALLRMAKARQAAAVAAQTAKKTATKTAKASRTTAATKATKAGKAGKATAATRATKATQAAKTSGARTAAATKKATSAAKAADTATKAARVEASAYTPMTTGRLDYGAMAKWAKKPVTDVPGEGRGDWLLREIVRQRGGDAAPQVISKAEAAKLAEQGWMRQYRGLTDRRFAEQFTYGEYFPGLGAYGNGTYVSTAADVAKEYAGKKGVVMEMMLNPKAKVGDMGDLAAESRTAAAKFLKAHTKGKRTQEMWTAAEQAEYATLTDIGRYAASKGYDAYDAMGGHYVILNRSALVIVK